MAGVEVTSRVKCSYPSAVSVSHVPLDLVPFIFLRYFASSVTLGCDLFRANHYVGVML
jgi:hypothetical protein